MKFYVLYRPKDGSEPFYAAREGERLPRYGGFEWMIYRDRSGVRPTWYVVEESSGLSVAEGRTKKDATMRFMEWINRAKIPEIRNSIEMANEKYGGSPNHRVTYL